MSQTFRSIPDEFPDTPKAPSDPKGRVISCGSRTTRLAMGSETVAGSKKSWWSAQKLQTSGTKGPKMLVVC